MKKICYLLILAVMILPSCSEDAPVKPAGGDGTAPSRTPEPPPETDPVVDDESDDEDKAAEGKAAEDKAADDQAAKAAAAAEAAEVAATNSEAAAAFAKELAELNEQFATDMKKWQATARAARTAAARTAAMKANPANQYGQEYLDLYENNSDVEGASAALIQALSRGAGTAKTKASELLLEMANADPDSEQTRDTYMSLARFGAGEAKDAAMGKLLDYAKADIESEAALDMLVTLGTMADPETKAEAFELLVENHVDNEKIVTMMAGMSRGMPTAATEKFLKAVAQNATGSVKTNAAITLAQFIDRRGMYQNIYADADEEMTERIGEEAVAYFNTKPDPNEAEMVEDMLAACIEAESDSALISKAESELFALRNLAVGATAMDIEAVDLDGKEFKLSDYRGKVVFLDFWGDW